MCKYCDAKTPINVPSGENLLTGEFTGGIFGSSVQQYAKSAMGFHYCISLPNGSRTIEVPIRFCPWCGQNLEIHAEVVNK